MILLIFVSVIVFAYGLSLVAPKLGLLAYPGEHRKHQDPTPMVGGIAIFFGLLVGFIFYDRSHLDLLPSMILLCVVGVLDDRFKLPSWSRFVAQALAAFLMIKLTGTQLSSLGFLLPGMELQLGEWSLPITIFATIGVINAINMSDGLDGLAGSLAVLVLAAVYCVNPEQKRFVLMAIAAIAGFLFWNYRVFRPSARLFMGDAGSTLLGLLITYMLIKSSQHPGQVIAPVTALWLLSLPLFDAIAVLLLRPMRGQSPFAADRIHYHHLIHAKGFGVNSTLLIVSMLQAALIVAGLWMFKLGISESWQLLGFLMCFGGYFLILRRETKRE